MKKSISKKLIHISLLAPLFLLANQDYSSESFQKAIESYNNKAFQDSYITFKEYAKKDKLDNDSTFILARSAYELGKFDEAESLYQELLQINPNNNRVKLELAQTYFQEKKYEEAEVLYKDVLKDKTIPLNVRRNIETTLASLDSKAQKHFVKTTLGFGYGYDSNVDNNSRDNFISGTNFELSDKKRSDQVAEYILALNHTYKLKDDLTIDNKFVGYMQKYNHEHDNDLGLAVFGTGLSYYAQNYKASVGFDYNYVWLDSKAYLNNYILSPSFEYQIDQNLLYKAKLNIIKKDFKQTDDKFRDSIYYELENSVVVLSENFGMNTFSLAFGSDNKDKGKAWNVDYEFGSLRYENMYSLTSSTLLTSGIELYADRYKVKEEVLYNKKRTDKKLILDLGLMQAISKNFTIATTLRYIDSKSNQNIYEYDKYIAKVNTYFSF